VIASIYLFVGLLAELHTTLCVDLAEFSWTVRLDPT